MSAFNKPNKLVVETGVSANGNVQDVKSAEQQLYELAVTTLIGRDSYYEKSDEKANRFAELATQLVAKGKLDFVANVLLYARTEMNIRNMPISGLVDFTAALRDRNVSYPKLRKLTCDVIGRVDQITDTLALIVGKLGSKAKLPMAIKRGLGDAFNKFNEYQFAKYNRGGAVKLSDALRVVHPVPKSDEQGQVFNKIMTNTLQTPDTWEVALSTKKDGQTKKEVWEGLIDRGVLGYQASLKNLRNMLEAGISGDHLEKVLDTLVKNVAKSKSLPFEFWTAYQATADVGNTRVKNALSDCMDAAVSNVPMLGDRVWVIVDSSGSMHGRAANTACYFASVIAKSHRKCQNFALTMFDSDARFVDLDQNSSVLGNFKYLTDRVNGGSTNFQAALEQESKLGFKPDVVFVLTDGEINGFGSTYTYGYNNMNQSGEVVAKACPRALKFVINMEAAETTPLAPRHGWYALAGWSEKIFDYVDALKKGTSILKLLDVPYPYKG